MKKICFISRQVYPLFNPNFTDKPWASYGGVEVDIFILAKELAKDKRFSVSIITGDFGQGDVEEYNQVKIFKSYKYEESKIKHIIKLWKIMKKVDADIYFQEGAGMITGIISLFCKRYKKKFIYRTASSRDSNQSFIKENLIEGIFYNEGIKHANLIITQNEEDKKNLLKFHKIDAKVINNLTEINKKGKTKKKYILWVGRSDRIKQPEKFMELARSLPQEKFLMICPASNINAVKSIDNEAKKIKNLEFIGRVPLNKIQKYYKEAKLFINTSSSEGFPNAFVQAAKNSTPIISLNVNPDKFLNKFNCGFCANGNLEIMKNEIINTLYDKKKFIKMSNNSYNYALKHHELKKGIKKYKEIFLD
jgi:glycosyltransferase involved in cell wall biosynthesis